MSVDVNGTNIIQSTPFSELFNDFKLMTSLSWSDVATQGSTIGFYPDDVLAATAFTADNAGGAAVMMVNNNDQLTSTLGAAVVGKKGNKGFAECLRYINFDADAKIGGDADEVSQSAFLTKVAGSATASPVV